MRYLASFLLDKKIYLTKTVVPTRNMLNKSGYLTKSQNFC